MELCDLTISRGMCSGRITGGGAIAPELQLVAGEATISVPEPKESADGWAFEVALPVALLSEGAHAVLIVEAGTGAQIGRFSLSVGEGLAEDLRAEVAQLRAEIDLLKAAFRREMRTRG